MEIKDPSFNYEQPELNYARHRQTDPRIAAHIFKALGSAKTILNVGAGSGSYEPEDKYVIALEPSATQRSQRKGHKVPAIIGTADQIPFDDKSFDASMALITVHHWPDIEAGLKELRRVTKDQVLVLTADPDALNNFWNADYFPELIEVEKARFPKIERITNALGGNCKILRIPVPIDCIDGFQEAFYARPEAFLEAGVRKAQSAWGFLEKGLEDILVKRLADDLASGAWDKKYGAHRSMPEFVGSMTLVVGRL